MQLRQNNVSSFRKALFVPFFLCLISLIPSIKSTYEWLELKTLDLLFTYSPFINNVTGQKNNIESPALIITKDQSFQEKFGHSPNRSDFAQLLNELKKQEIKVAALDFIYDEPTNEKEDYEFIHQLESFPFPILAHNFVGRGQQSFNLVDINDKNADRPAWPKNLYKPIVEKVASKGLINVPADLDSVIRYAPLAFHPDDSDRFLPTLGFSSWIIYLLSEKENIISKIDLSTATSLEKAISIINNAAPYNFNTTGHLGLDKAIAELETQFIIRYLHKNYPHLLKDYDYSLLEELVTNTEIKTKTWAKLPIKPLPLIGSYHTPCLRLPYKKLAAPFKGDGIDNIAMTRFINTEEEANSTYLFSKNQITISNENPTLRLSLPQPACQKGINTLRGEIKTVTGKPVSNASIWAIMPQNGFWTKSTTDENGQYTITEVPDGNVIINVFKKEENGCDKAMLSIKVSEKEVKLPLLLLADNTNNLTISTSELPKIVGLEIWVHGEIIPMLHSNQNGETKAHQIPPNYSLISLNDEDDAEEEILSLNEEGKLVLNNNISINNTVAVMPDEDYWKIHFYRKQSINHKEPKQIISNLPSSLDATISLTSKNTNNNNKNNQEIIIKPGLTTDLTTLPDVFYEDKSTTLVTTAFSKSAAPNTKAILLSDFGDEITINNKAVESIPSGNYIVLTESENKCGIYKAGMTDKKVVFIGTSMPTDQDFIVSPINFLDQNFSRMPGVNIHANLFSALYNQEFFYTPPFHMDCAPKAWPYYQFLLILPILIILSIKFKNAESTKSTLIVLAFIAILFICAIWLFPQRILIPVFYPSMLILSFAVTRGFVEWINSRRLAHETQNAFSRFISADVVSQIINNPDAIKPGGEKKELTIIFTDIAGFTSISEKLEAEALTELMNSYLDAMTNILFKHGGTLDKYIGDAIMGFWNHPTSQEDHATRAVACAIDMQKKLKEMREDWMAQGLPKVEVRAGINTGTCMVGFIGSKTQMNFTCLGDNVNLASRLEGANKTYGTYIMITEAVKQKLSPYIFSTRFLDFLAVKGKEQPVLVYEVRGWTNEETEIWKNKAGKLYQQGIDKYLAREWDKAISLFEEVLSMVEDDAPSKVYIERCKTFKQTPPPEQWDGRFILKTK